MMNVLLFGNVFTKTERWRMKKLVARFGKAVKGVLTGFDRIVFKGTILPLAYEEGAMSFLRWRGVLNRDYKQWMQAQSQALITDVDRYVQEQCAHPIVKLSTWRHDKEQLARKRQAKTGIEAGLIGAWSCLEGCWSYRACYCAEKGYPQLHRYRTQCKHLYLYFDHKDYGWMNIRLQTWFPYHIQIALNGREWLRRRLEKRGVDFLRQGNKFLHIEDYAVAQRFLNRQLDRRWPHLLNSFLSSAFPSMTQTLGPHLSYYWTLWQSEWATDLIMNTPAELTPTMASILRYAWVTGNSANVLRYLGRPLTSSGTPHANSNHEVMSRVLDFHDGLRVRHWVDHNSVKAYNEQNVLRIETTINMPDMFKVYRRAQGQSHTARKKLRPLRKGVADIPLRAQVSQEVNDRLMDELSTFTDKTPISELLAPHVRRRKKDGRRVRALDISGKDRELLKAISDPAFTVSGMTNAALRQKLCSTNWGVGRTEKQLSARVSRHLRLLRDHGLIRKLPNRHRYHLTDRGRQLTTALNVMLRASTEQLLSIAA
jgi:hypothetical protein